MTRFLATCLVLVFGIAWAGVGVAATPLAAAPLGAAADPAPARWSADLSVRELGMPSGFRLRVTYAPDVAPAFKNHLFLVQADSSFGENAYFIPTDMALEYGDTVYSVRQDLVSDTFGSILGGRLREDETLIGFFWAPVSFDMPAYLAGTAEADTTGGPRLRLRYANRRADFHLEGDEVDWDEAVPPGTLMAAINAWWESERSLAELEPVTDSSAWLIADRVMPGQAELILRSHISPTELRNTIVRVGERRLVRSPIVQRVVPHYPTAARQAGVGGVVVVLAYTSRQGAVEDVLVLASDTAHLLNIAAVTAVGQWKFLPAKDETGVAVDGWRVIPVQFQIGDGKPEPVPMPQELHTDPVVLRKAPAEYPDQAFHKRIEGTVVYEVTVDETGKLKEAVLVQSVHPLVDRTALVAVEKCLFEPATEAGVPVEGTVRISYTFPPPPANHK